MYLLPSANKTFREQEHVKLYQAVGWLVSLPLPSAPRSADPVMQLQQLSVTLSSAMALSMLPQELHLRCAPLPWHYSLAVAG